MSTVLADKSNISETAHHGDSWRTIGKHPLLELKHSVEDRLLVATHINFLGLRAMLHRNKDTSVLFSDTIDEPKTAGNAVGTGPLSRPPDRMIILTDRHMYVVSSPSSAIFAPASSGQCFPLAEFSRMACISNANSAVIQFVGGIVAARFSTKKDCERCSHAVYTATGIPTETLTAEELDQLHQRRSFGSSTKLSRFVKETVKDAVETQSIAAGSEASTAAAGGGGGAGRKRILKSDNGSVTNSVDNMLRFVLDGESELGQYDAGFPNVSVQATCDTDEIGISAKPEMVDAATSPIENALMPMLGAGGGSGGLSTRSYARRIEHDSDDEKGDVGDSIFSTLRNGPKRHARPSDTAANYARGSGGGGGGGGGGFSMSGGASGAGGGGGGRHAGGGFDDNDSFSFTNASMIRTGSGGGGAAGGLGLGLGGTTGLVATPRGGGDDGRGAGGAGGRRAGNVSPSGSGGGPSIAGPSVSSGGVSNANAAQFDSWLGVLAQYRPAMEDLGITSANKLMRIPPGPEWEAFLDEVGVTRAGHRVLLTTKVTASRK